MDFLLISTPSSSSAVLLCTLPLRAPSTSNAVCSPMKSSRPHLEPSRLPLQAISPSFLAALVPLPREGINTSSSPASSAFDFSFLFSPPRPHGPRALTLTLPYFPLPDAFYCSHFTCSYLTLSTFSFLFFFFFPRPFLCAVTADPTCNVLQGPLSVPLPPPPLPHPGPLADVHVVPVAGPPACSSCQLRLAAARSFRDVFRRVNVVPAPGPPACAPRLRLSFARARPEGIPADPRRSFDPRATDPIPSFVAPSPGSTCGS